MRLRLQMLLAAVAVAFASAAAAQSTPAFNTLPTPQPAPADGRIEVLEFFWYGCEHCYRLEPLVDAWLPKQGKDVVFRRVPAIAAAAWVAHAHLYYTLEALGRIDDLHPKIFEAIHRQGLKLDQPAVRDKWLAAQDVDVGKYAEAENSFGVIAKMERAESLARAFRLEAVPTLAVQGKYTTNPFQAGGHDKVFPIVDQLVARERKR